MQMAKALIVILWLHIFLNIAASRGCERSAEYRQELAMDMSAKEIAKAQKVCT